MNLRRLLLAPTIALAALAMTAAPSSAIVGGSDAGAGEFPSVAEITFGAFGCTGTLISPDTVLSAGHCGSLTGAAVATPVGWPPQLITVRVGSNKPGQGETVPVSSVSVSPNASSTGCRLPPGRWISSPDGGTGRSSGLTERPRRRRSSRR